MKKSKKSRHKKIIFWLVLDLLVTVVVLYLFFYRPSYYNPIAIELGSSESGQISTYLTHDFYPQIYNNVQYNRPFDVILTQDGLNDIINEADWPMESNGVLLHSPAAIIVPGVVMFMGTADFKGAEFIITIELMPKMNEDGLANLHVTKLKVGALNVSAFARVIARDMYNKQTEGYFIQPDDIQSKIVDSLLDNKAFDPVFEVNKRKVRVEKIKIEKEKITARLVPLSQ